MYITNFTAIYFEPAIKEYPLGKFLLQKFSSLPQIEISSHNHIEELQKSANSDFTKLKRYLIIGVRKTHTYVENHKISDYLVPFSSSGCSAMCLYCYLVCHYNKCSYLRIFVNTDQMLEKLVKKSNQSETELTFEIGSNSDLILENLVTENLVEHLQYFLEHTTKGRLTFPTKFHYVEPLLSLPHQNRILVRMSLNPERIIQKVELGTSHLQERLEAINQLASKGYATHILIAPVIITDNFEQDYTSLLEEMKEKLNHEAKENITFEIIFMTYSYIHRMINADAFPKAISLYSTTLMTSRGIGKYHYRDSVKEEAKKFLIEKIADTFEHYEILYIV